MTDEERLRAAMDLMDAALDRPPAEREALLAACDDPAIRAKARELLAADDRAEGFLSQPATGALASEADLAGTLVGSFRLDSLLGRGGMGEVWVGVRESADFEQRVAVKLLPFAADEAAAVRFRRERRILARLSHPCIARLLDGGVTPEGRPWLAMELVDGVGLLEHCGDLDVEARLRIFVQVCDAVQYAHRNLVVHRDLKPSNILVTKAGEPKLLDFGIAKLLARDDDEPLTRTNERPMTLDYAAPEQVRGDPVTTASDVWSLGVVLHELLSGVRPYGTTSKNRLETEQAILAATPSRPSARATDDALRRELRGDLDAIVLQAMRAEPKERYASAEELGADVRRYLEHAPVAARGDATGYVIRAMVRRHRAAFAFSAVVLASLVVGLVGTLWQAHRAREEARKAEKAESFLVDMLRAFDPEQAGGKPITQRDILARGEKRISELDDQPDVQARLLEVFAETWYAIEAYDEAKVAAERALALERRTSGPRSIEVAKTLDLLGNVEFEKSSFGAAESRLDDALAIARGVEGPNGLTVATILNDLAGVKRRTIDYAAAEKLRRQALGIFHVRVGDEDPRTVAVMNDLAVLLGDEARFAESAELQDRACKLFVRVRGAANPDTLVCRSNLARDLVEEGKAADGERILADVQTSQARVLGDDWPDIPHTEELRGRALVALGRAADAVLVFEDAARRARKSGDDVEVASVLTYESLALRDASRLADAESTARRALGMCCDRLGDEHASTARARWALGTILAAEGRAADARVELRAALALQEKRLGPSHPETARTRAALTDLGAGKK
jgi:serine/threonine protein kinase